MESGSSSSAPAASPMALSTPRAPNSQVSDHQTFDVLKVSLHASSYNWNFVPIAGSAFTDSERPSATATLRLTPRHPRRRARSRLRRTPPAETTPPPFPYCSAPPTPAEPASPDVLHDQRHHADDELGRPHGPFPLNTTSLVQFFSTDDAANAEAVKSQQLRIDATPPVTTITCNAKACAASYTAAVSVKLGPPRPGARSHLDALHHRHGPEFQRDRAQLHRHRPLSSATATVKFISLDAAGNAEPPRRNPF